MADCPFRGAVAEQNDVYLNTSEIASSRSNGDQAAIVPALKGPALPALVRATVKAPRSPPFHLLVTPVSLKTLLRL